MEGKTDFLLVWINPNVLFAAQCINSSLSSLEMERREKLATIFLHIEDRKCASIICGSNSWLSLRTVHISSYLHDHYANY
jgi:hypothetical protein